MRIVFAAGGTGGHLYPALVTALELRRRDEECETLFLVSPRGREREILEGYGFACEELPVSGFGRMVPLRLLQALTGMARGFWRAVRLMRGKGMDVLVGFGAYVSVAPALAARLLGMKVVIHEQNAVMGRANRFLLRFADRVALGFPCAAPVPDGRRPVVTGIPLRPEMRAAVTEEDARSYLGLAEGKFTLLIMGGSQGAHALNALAMEGAAALAGAGTQIIHLSGDRDYSAVFTAYARADVPAVVLPYLEEMHWAYAAADCAVCRCGAMTLAEIAYAGLPSVLVPYPHAVADHQAANGRIFQRAGAALCVSESELTPSGLAGIIRSLKGDAVARERMGKAARSLAVPDAAERLADLIGELVGRTP